MYYGDYAIIGRCSICGGRVGVPRLWSSVIPAVPTCLDCGAVKQNSGPVIPMIPKKPYVPSPWNPRPKKPNPDTIWRTSRNRPYSERPIPFWKFDYINLI